MLLLPINSAVCQFFSNAIHPPMGGLSFLFANITQRNGSSGQAWTQATQCKDDPSEWAIIMARVTRCPLMPRLGLHATLHPPTATRGSSKNKWINDSPLRGGMSPCPPPSIYRHACLVLSLSSPLLLATFSLYILFIIGDAFCSCFHQSAFS